MGTYLYTHRARTINLNLGNGGRVKCHQYKFATRVPWSYDERVSKYMRRAKEQAREGIINNSTGWIFIGDKPEEGASVFAQTYEGHWYDCEKFPGVHVGYLKKVGRRWFVSRFSNWTECKRLIDGVWARVEYRYRLSTAGGRVSEEVRQLGKAEDPFPALTGRMTALAEFLNADTDKSIN